MKHTLVALMEDKPGVLNRVVNMFSRRAFNIDSMTVGKTETADISRMTIVVDAANNDVEQVVKQLYKIIDVLKVSDLTHDKAILRDLALIKVTVTRDTRADIVQMATIVGGKIVDLAADSIIVQMVDTEDALDDFVTLMRPFGIKEIVRTGRVAMVRGSLGVTRAPNADELVSIHVRRDAPPPKAKVAIDLTGDAG